MKVQATLHNYRRSTKKVVETARILRGLTCTDALTQLSVLNKKDADVLTKLIKSAMANAANNFGLDKTTLFIDEIVLGAGPTMKRWMPRAHGRAAAILKRTCNITIVVDQKKETKKEAAAKAKAVKAETKAEKTPEKKASVKKKAVAEKKEAAPKKETKSEATQK